MYFSFTFCQTNVSLIFGYEIVDERISTVLQMTSGLRERERNRNFPEVVLERTQIYGLSIE